MILRIRYLQISMKEVPQILISTSTAFIRTSKDKLINQNWSLYIRPDKVTPDEWFDTLLHWFAPKGEEILTVYGRNDDGEASDVQIRNSQEANAWLEKHPVLRKI